METLQVKPKIESKKNRLKKVKTIPKELVYEIIDGKEIYYAGYKEVLNKQKNIEDIMGCSMLQSFIVNLIVKYFYKIEFKGNKKYQLFYSELGLHITNRNNLAADIAIYNKSDISEKDITDKYANKAPRVVFEIDTKADFDNLDVLSYIELKTKKLIDFGTEKVIWVLTKSEKIIVLQDSKNWIFHNWNDKINIIDDISFTLKELLAESDLK